MKNHTKVYIRWAESAGISPEEISCIVCGKVAGTNFIMDIHHIENRKAGGSKTKDYAENLAALCRSCHEKYGDKKQYKEFLKNKQKELIDERKKVR